MSAVKHSQAMHFHARAGEKVRNAVLQRALQKAKPLFVGKRAKGMVSLAEDGLDFQLLRSTAKNIRNRTLADLDVWLDIFEERATATGAEVLWARDGAEVSRLVVDIARRHGVSKAVKSKSMLSEEAQLNEALAAAGVRPVETDLGEYIVQLAGEAPSHIIAPAVHKTINEIEALFAKEHDRPLQTRTSADIPAMAQEARAVLRQHFLSAEMGISGANFLIAETGSAALVTNEGNGRMVTTLPKVHVVITGSDYQDMLRCIRCGACMNHCPVYFSLGGHAYGWVYPGPMGSVLTPLFTGIENALDLPHASTGCNQCGAVCPVEIPLPTLMHRLREEQNERGLRPWSERLALKAWAWMAGKPLLYRWFARRAARYLNWLADGSGRIRIFGLAPEWTAGRDLPVSSGRTFHELYSARKKT